jgi:hypothetical protein
MPIVFLLIVNKLLVKLHLLLFFVGERPYSHNNYHFIFLTKLLKHDNEYNITKIKNKHIKAYLF